MVNRKYNYRQMTLTMVHINREYKWQKAMKKLIGKWASSACTVLEQRPVMSFIINRDYGSPILW